jgi:fumarate hydratase class II
MEPDLESIARHLDRSLMLVTALVPRIGYDRAAKVASKARDQNLTLREAVLKLNLLTAAEFDAIVDPAAMTGDTSA